jgi:hypothetical protein
MTRRSDWQEPAHQTKQATKLQDTARPNAQSLTLRADIRSHHRKARQW